MDTVQYVENEGSVGPPGRLSGKPLRSKGLVWRTAWVLSQLPLWHEKVQRSFFSLRDLRA